jgi:hypothetical protein
MLIFALLSNVKLWSYIIAGQVDMDYVVGESISNWQTINEILHQLSGLQTFILQISMYTSFLQDVVFWDLSPFGILRTVES